MDGMLHISRFDVIPKSTPGKWRLITDLSHPEGGSVNNGIHPSMCTLHYTSVDRVARSMQKYGKGALMAKIDVKSAYRLVPVHPDDRYLLGVKWEDQFCMLPFGLRSAPVIYTAVADAFEMILKAKGIEDIDNYVDDVITFGPPQSSTCQQNLTTILEESAKLGISMAPEKIVLPTTCLVFLGIEIDSASQILRLPQEKLDKLKQVLHQWVGKKTWKRKELESLIGYLSHACKVVRPGRSFLRHMISLLKVAQRQHHHIRINKEFQADLKWWAIFSEQWNGVSSFPSNPSYAATFVSDASGSWGCAAVHQSHWFQYKWTELSTNKDITWKELLPVLVATVLWGRGWKGMHVLAYCDNEPVVSLLHTRSSPQKHIMQLLQCLFFIEATFDFSLQATHIAGKSNYLADALSRNKLHLFFSQLPSADKDPIPILHPLLQILQDPDLDWTSPRWTGMFVTSLNWD